MKRPSEISETAPKATLPREPLDLVTFGLRAGKCVPLASSSLAPVLPRLLAWLQEKAGPHVKQYFS